MEKKKLFLSGLAFRRLQTEKICVLICFAMKITEEERRRHFSQIREKRALK